MVPVACRCFAEIESVEFIEGVLRRTQHNGFPVVDPSLQQERGGPTLSSR